ncbi:hypothetical protein BDQ17DRAFT_1422511 [Cyathus striatus]|nr:hypothetical protein BDQ17DRAFT_1422511 [Cyathus striatus]
MKHGRSFANPSSSKSAPSSKSTRAGKRPSRNHSSSSTRSLVESIRGGAIENADCDTVQSAAVTQRSPYWRPTKAHRLASDFFEDFVPTVFTSYRDQGSSARLGSVIPSLPLVPPPSGSAAELARRVVIDVDPEDDEEDKGRDTADEDEDEDEDEAEPEDTIGDSLSSFMMATLRARSLEEQTDDFLDTVPVPITIQTAQLPTLSSTTGQPSVLSQPIPSQSALSQPSIPTQPDDDDDDDEYFDAMEDQLADPEASGVSAATNLSVPQVEPSSGSSLSGEDSEPVVNCLPPVFNPISLAHSIAGSNASIELFSCSTFKSNTQHSSLDENACGFQNAPASLLPVILQDSLPPVALNNHSSAVYLASSSSHVYEQHGSLLSDFQQNVNMFSAASEIPNNERYSAAIPQSIRWKQIMSNTTLPLDLLMLPAENYSNWFDIDIREWKLRTMSSGRDSGVTTAERQDDDERANVEASNERDADAKEDSLNSAVSTSTPPSAETTSSLALHPPTRQASSHSCRPIPSCFLGELSVVETMTKLFPQIVRRSEGGRVLLSLRMVPLHKIILRSSLHTTVAADIEQQVSTSRHICLSSNPPSSPSRPSSSSSTVTLVRTPEPRSPSKGQKRCRDEEECTLSSDSLATQGKTKRRRSDVPSSVDRTKSSTSGSRSLKLVTDTSERRVQDVGSQKPKKKSRHEDKENTSPCAPETSSRHARKSASQARNVSNVSKLSALDDSLVEDRSSRPRTVLGAIKTLARKCESPRLHAITAFLKRVSRPHWSPVTPVSARIWDNNEEDRRVVMILSKVIQATSTWTTNIHTSSPSNRRTIPTSSLSDTSLYCELTLRPGPYILASDGSAIRNPHSLTAHANVFLIDQPIGFRYSATMYIVDTPSIYAFKDFPSS